jgi:hypothetical protein
MKAWTMVPPGPCWSTAAVGGECGPQPRDLEALGEHLQRCRAGTGRGFAWRCGAESVGGFVAARSITSLLLLTVLLAVAVWLLP